MAIESDKLTEEFTIRIPEITKNLIKQLDSQQKKRLNEAILVTMARALHDAKFDPSKYLKSD